MNLDNPTGPLHTIGNTPIVKLRRLVPLGAADVWLKIEGGNPTGSYKDRMALSMVEAVEASGELGDKSLLECTGGSTGTSLAFVCAVISSPTPTPCPATATWAWSLSSRWTHQSTPSVVRSAPRA